MEFFTIKIPFVVLVIAGIPINSAYSSSDISLAKQGVKDVGVLPLEGGINFRDIGGYKTKDDRITNGLGLPMGPVAFKETEEIREELGLNNYRPAANTLQPR